MSKSDTKNWREHNGKDEEARTRVFDSKRRDSWQRPHVQIKSNRKRCAPKAKFGGSPPPRRGGYYSLRPTTLLLTLCISQKTRVGVVLGLPVGSVFTRVQPASYGRHENRPSRLKIPRVSHVCAVSQNAILGPPPQDPATEYICPGATGYAHHHHCLRSLFLDTLKKDTSN